MEPISATAAFATIVSLLADFVSHRGANESKSYGEFMAWLSEQRHDEMKNLLELNTKTSIGIKALLGENKRDILEKLESLDRSMASFAAGFDAYRGIAQATHPTSILSEQAISLLTQFYDSGASRVIVIHHTDDPTTICIENGPTNGELTYTDTRFLSDDLSILVELGFLDLEHNDIGGHLYSLRRSAARFVEGMRGA